MLPLLSSPFLISRAHVSPHGCSAAHIFSYRLNFVLIASALVFLCGQLGGKPHSSGPPVSLRVPCHYGLLIFQPQFIKAWRVIHFPELDIIRGVIKYIFLERFIQWGIAFNTKSTHNSKSVYIFTINIFIILFYFLKTIFSLTL